MLFSKTIAFIIERVVNAMGYKREKKYQRLVYSIQQATSNTEGGGSSINKLLKTKAACLRVLPSV